MEAFSNNFNHLIHSKDAPPIDIFLLQAFDAIYPFVKHAVRGKVTSCLTRYIRIICYQLSITFEISHFVFVSRFREPFYSFLMEKMIILFFK